MLALSLVMIAALASCDPSPDSAIASLGKDVHAVASVPIRRATHDPSMDVTIGGSRELRYDAGADASIDRAAFVRAGSGLVIRGDTAFVPQDDALFVGTIDLAAKTGGIGAITLPAGADGVRLFDDGRGNKSAKMDLESLVDLGDGELLAIGSGAAAPRKRLVLVRGNDARVIDATALFDALAVTPEFSGSQLNLEGAIVVEHGGEKWLRLFQRGNGAPKDGRMPIDAIADVPLADALAGRAPRSIERVSQYELGSIDSVRLTFADATQRDGATWYLASAENSPDAIHDGEQLGTVIGRIDPKSGEARYGRILEADGTPTKRKFEGLAFDSVRSRWLFVEDKDDPQTPSELAWTK